MTPAQRRLIETIRRYGVPAEFWPVVNDWVSDAGPQRSLALRNINRTVAALEKIGACYVDRDGCFRLGKQSDHEHTFTASIDNPMYCADCGASETDHTL